MQNHLKKMPRTVLLLGVVSFLGDISSEMLYPVTPIFLSQVLGASMISLGLIEGLAEAFASVLKIYSGALSDRLGSRKYFVVVGYLLSAFAKPTIGLATLWQHVLFARLLDRAGKGIRTSPRDAMIAEAVPRELRGTAYGIHRAFDTAGAMIGPLVTLGLLSVMQIDMRLLFHLAFIPGILGVLLVLRLRESKPKLHLAEAQSSMSFKDWRRLPKSFWWFVGSWAVFYLGNSSDSFLILKAEAEIKSFSTVILLYCGFNMVYAVASPYLGALSDKVDRHWLLIGGLCTFAIVYAGFALAESVWQFVLLFALYGLFMAATEGVSRALVVDHVPKDLKGTALGIFAGVTGLCALIASLTAGYAWQMWSPSFPFWIGTGAAIAAASLLFLTRLSLSKTF